MMSTRAPGRANKVKEQCVWFGQPCKRGLRVHVKNWWEVIIICKAGKYGGSASNEWEVDCHWKVKRINCFHTWIPKGMGYVGSDDVGNIHKVQVCTLMKYYPDQAVGSRKMVSRHTKRIAKVTMDPEVKCMVWKCGLCRGSYDSSFWSW